jgi:hypothetical protein
VGELLVVGWEDGSRGDVPATRYQDDEEGSEATASSATSSIPISTMAMGRPSRFILVIDARRGIFGTLLPHVKR